MFRRRPVRISSNDSVGLPWAPWFRCVQLYVVTLRVSKTSPILNLELWQPGAKTIGKYPMTPRGLKREFEHYPGNARTALVYLELAPDPWGILASVP